MIDILWKGFVKGGFIYSIKLIAKLSMNKNAHLSTANINFDLQ